MSARRRRTQHGMVTAELATIAPFGVAFTLLLVWIVSLGLTQVRLTDAARDSAREVARGESVDVATQVARQHAPHGTHVDIDIADGVATVTVSAESRLPVPFFADVGSRTLHATAAAVIETP